MRMWIRVRVRRSQQRIKLGKFSAVNQDVEKEQKAVTSEDEMGPCQHLAPEHLGSDGFTDDTETQRNDEEHEER